MTSYTITYRTEDADDLRATVEADTAGAAYLAFHRSHPVTNVSSIEAVTVTPLQATTPVRTVEPAPA